MTRDELRPIVWKALLDMRRDDLDIEDALSRILDAATNSQHEALGLIADIAEGSATANSLPHIAKIAREATNAQSPAPTAAEIYEQCLQCVRSFGPTDDKTRNGIAGIIEHFKGLYERDFGFATPQPAQSDVVREAVRYAIGSLERDIIHKAAQISACDPRQDIYIRNLSAQKATLEAHLAALSAPRPAPEGDNPTGKQSLQVADVDPNDVWEAYLDETDNPSPQGAIAFAVNFMLHDESQEVDRQ